MRRKNMIVGQDYAWRPHNWGSTRRVTYLGTEKVWDSWNNRNKTILRLRKVETGEEIKAHSGREIVEPWEVTAGKQAAKKALRAEWQAKEAELGMLARRLFGDDVTEIRVNSHAAHITLSHENLISLFGRFGSRGMSSKKTDTPVDGWEEGVEEDV